MARILLVEDSPTQSAMYSSYLVQAGHHVDAVDLGKAAIAKLSLEKYDLMLLDLKLPDMNGLDVLSTDEVEEVTPTIVLTANGSVKAAVDAMRLGAIDFLMKPCNGEKLCETVAKALSRVQQHVSTDTKSETQKPSDFV